MSNEGIRNFQELLDDPWFWLELEAIGSHVLWQAEVRVSAETTPLTWDFLSDVVRALKALSPWVSDDPMCVKAREVAPHLIKELWCETGRIERAAEDVALELDPATALGIYTECHMDDGRLELDSRHGLGAGTIIDHLQGLCRLYAVRVLSTMADWDLDPEV